MKLISYAFSALMMTMPVITCGCSGNKAYADDLTADVTNFGNHGFFGHTYDRSENEITKSLNVKNFHGIDSRHAIKVVYTQVSEYKVIFKGDKDDYDNLKWNVEDGILTIGTKSDMKRYKEDAENITLYITAPHLNDLRAKGVLNIKAKSMKEDDMHIEVGGVFNADIDDLRCDTYEMDNRGVLNYVGKVTARNVDINTRGVDNSMMSIESKAVSISIKGVSNANLDIKGGTVDITGSGVGNTLLTLDCESIYVNTSGCLNITLKGTADNVEISGSGTANVNQKGLNNF